MEKGIKGIGRIDMVSMLAAYYQVRPEDIEILSVQTPHVTQIHHLGADGFFYMKVEISANAEPLVE